MTRHAQAALLVFFLHSPLVVPAVVDAAQDVSTTPQTELPEAGEISPRAIH